MKRQLANQVNSRHAKIVLLSRGGVRNREVEEVRVGPFGFSHARGATGGHRSLSELAERPLFPKRGTLELKMTLARISHHMGKGVNSVFGGADIPVCPFGGVFPGRQECLPHRGEKCGLALA
jgi:hypothetical protein